MNYKGLKHLALGALMVAIIAFTGASPASAEARSTPVSSAVMANEQKTVTTSQAKASAGRKTCELRVEGIYGSSRPGKKISYHFSHSGFAAPKRFEAHVTFKKDGTFMYVDSKPNFTRNFHGGMKKHSSYVTDSDGKKTWCGSVQW